MSSQSSSQWLRFEDGAVQFRQRLIVSILSHRPLLIRNIRSDDLDAPGLKPHEASFLRLLDQLTNGTRIEINTTGTQLRFFPGIFLGGSAKHACPVGEASTSNNNNNNEDNDDDDDENDQEHRNPSYRSIGWFIEGVLPLAPFGKQDLSIQFTGITDGTCHLDPSVDYWKASALPLLNLFGIKADTSDIMGSDGPSLQVRRRGAAPLGGGQVHFFCPRVLELQPIDWTDYGKIKRVRGTAVSCKLVSSSAAARVAFCAKGVLHRLLPDVWIHTDVHTVKQHQCGPSPSVSALLTAQSTSGVMITAETCLQKDKKTGRLELYEDLGTRVAVLLLDEIRKGGCIDTGLQSLALLWMCLTPEDVSRLRIGSLTPYTIASLRLFKQVWGIEFKLVPDHDTKTILVSCLGTGYRNMARAST